MNRTIHRALSLFATLLAVAAFTAGCGEDKHAEPKAEAPAEKKAEPAAKAAEPLRSSATSMAIAQSGPRRRPANARKRFMLIVGKTAW